jgi:hypothetical protein
MRSAKPPSSKSRRVNFNASIELVGLPSFAMFRSAQASLSSSHGHQPRYIDIARNEKHLKYPHRLNFYSRPPLEEITIEEFEIWAIDRLRSACCPDL